MTNNVGSEFGRCSLEGGFNRFHDRAHRSIKCNANLFASHHLCARKAGCNVTTAHVGSKFLFQWPCRPKLQLHFLGGVFANVESKLASEHFLDCFIQFVTCNTGGMSSDNAAHRDNRNFRGATTNINNEVRARQVHGKPRTDGGGHRLFNDVHGPACASELGRILNCSTLHARNLRRYTDDHSRFVPAACVHLLNKETEHLFTNVEVGNHTIFKGANESDVLWSTTPHPFCLKTNRDQLAGLVIYRNS